MTALLPSYRVWQAGSGIWFGVLVYGRFVLRTGPHDTEAAALHGLLLALLEDLYAADVQLSEEP